MALQLPNGAKVTARETMGLYQVPYEPAGRGGFKSDVNMVTLMAEAQTVAMLAAPKGTFGRSVTRPCWALQPAGFGQDLQGHDGHDDRGGAGHSELAG